MYIHYIYKVTNILNGNYYYGKHSQEFGKIDNYYGSGKVIKNAIKKHGLHNFIKEIIAFYDTDNDAFDAERALLTDKILNDQKCYNIYPGGKGAPNSTNHPMFNKLTVYDENNNICVITKDKYYSNKNIYRTTQYGKLTVYDENNNKLFIDKEKFDPLLYNSIYLGVPLADTAKQKLKTNSSLIGKVCILQSDGEYKLITVDEYKSGNYITHWSGKKHSQETKDKISDKNKGKKHSQETKDKISKNLIGKLAGEKNPNYGKTGMDTISYGLVIVRDENNNIFKPSVDNPDYVSGKLKFAFSGENNTFYNKTFVKIDGKKTLISKDDIDYINGKYEHANKGNIHSEETKKKISDKLTGRKLSEEHKAKVCLNLDRRKKVMINNIIFDSVKDAKLYCKNVLNISYRQMKKQINSADFEDWFYIT